jgi:thioredoxin-like negative regulator of GroEL
VYGSVTLATARGTDPYTQLQPALSFPLYLRPFQSNRTKNVRRKMTFLIHFSPYIFCPVAETMIKASDVSEEELALVALYLGASYQMVQKSRRKRRMNRVTRKDLRQAVNERPDDAMAARTLGMALRESLEYEAALKYLFKSRRVGSNLP